MIDVIIRSNQALLFTAEGDENNRATRLGTLRQTARQFNQSGCAGSVVVGAVMDFALARRQAALAATAQMIVMGANYNDLALQLRIRAGENAHHVERWRLAANNVNRKVNCLSLNRKSQKIGTIYRRTFTLWFTTP